MLNVGSKIFFIGTCINKCQINVWGFLCVVCEVHEIIFRWRELRIMKRPEFAWRRRNSVGGNLINCAGRLVEGMGGRGLSLFTLVPELI